MLVAQRQSLGIFKLLALQGLVILRQTCICPRATPWRQVPLVVSPYPVKTPFPSHVLPEKSSLHFLVSSVGEARGSKDRPDFSWGFYTQWWFSPAPEYMGASIHPATFRDHPLNLLKINITEKHCPTKGGSGCFGGRGTGGSGSCALSQS